MKTYLPNLLAASPSSPSRLKSMVKAVSWRAFGAADTFALAFCVTGHAGAASTIMGAEVLTKSLLYYAHERAWETGWFLKFTRRVFDLCSRGGVAWRASASLSRL